MKLSTSLEHLCKTITAWVKHHERLLFIALTLVSLLFMLASVSYGAWASNHSLSNNSDDITYPYLFNNFKLHDLSLPAEHSNIIKFPLFIAQSVFPYNHVTFMIVTIGLVVATVILWVWLAWRIFGTAAAIIISSVLGLFALASPSFISQQFGNTIRNIEYPIALGFIITILWLVLTAKRLRRRQLWLIGLVSAIFAATIAGDTLILYQSAGALLIGLLLFWLQGQVPIRKLVLGVGLVVASCLGGIILKLILVKTGIVHLEDNIGTGMHIVPIAALAPSITTALQQLLGMFGANIFGEVLSLKTILPFVSFGIVASLVLYFVTEIKRVVNGAAARLTLADALSAVVAICFFLTFALYIFSDQVVVGNPLGGYSPAGRERYLTILPLLGSIGVYGLIRRTRFSLKQAAFGVLVLSLLVSFISHGYALARYRASYPSANAMHVSLSEAASYLSQNHVTVFGAGYWYGSSVKFNSSEPLIFFALGNCNKLVPNYNIRYSWSKPNAAIKKSALIIDRTGPDRPFWQCSDTQLANVYGQPVQQKTFMAAGYPVQIRIYPYDIRTKLDR